MTRTRRWRWAAAGLLLTLIATAWGGDDGGGGSADAVSNEGEPVELSMWLFDEFGYQHLARRAAEHPP